MDEQEASPVFSVCFPCWMTGPEMQFLTIEQCLVTYFYQRPPKATLSDLKCGGPLCFYWGLFMVQDKPFKTTEKLVSLLVDERQLACPDLDAFAKFLRRTNYYRFSGYARQFQRNPRYGDNRFIEGSCVDDIIDIMDLDDQLRRLLFRQLAVIEIGVRSVLAHELGRRYGSGAFYLDESSYLDLNDKPGAIVASIVKDLARSKSASIAHYADASVCGDDVASLAKRYRNVPIWAAIEVVSFGRLSNMIEYFSDRDSVKASAAVLSVQWDPFGSVIHSLSVLRNLCCHHGQIWHRRLDIQCPVQKKLRPRNVPYDPAGPYAAIVMANHYRKKIDGDTVVAEEIAALLNSNQKFAEGIYFPQPR